jgi:hypothetical protein
MSTNRRVLNKLHEELSVMKGSLWPRYPLWLELNEAGYDPENLTPQDATVWCESKGHLSVARKMSRYNPDLETPDEIFERFSSS